nr:immunoglobulin heavy chain junction region [Mus musculus]MBK4184550.1 immunoglobulin heavy chain junction region [Mus musculus]
CARDYYGSNYGFAYW